MQFFAVLFMLAAAVAAVAVWYFLAKEMSRIAGARGHSENKYFHVCFWLGLFGFLVVLALPDLIARAQRDRLIQLTEQSAQAAPASNQPEAMILPKL